MLRSIKDHLRDEMGALQPAGLAEDEALLIALRRMGSAALGENTLLLANLAGLVYARLPWVVFA